MSEELACKNKRYPHGCHPHYAKKYHGYCLECANAGIPELDEELAAQSAEIKRLRAACEAAKDEISRRLYAAGCVDDGCGPEWRRLRRLADQLAAALAAAPEAPR